MSQREQPGRVTSKTLLLLAAVACAACEPSTVEGSLVAYSALNSRYFKTRVQIPITDFEHPVEILLPHTGAHCRVVLNASRNALSAPGKCQELVGAGVFSCKGRKDLDFRWMMDSCHSGFGRSDERGQPEFAFGLGSNYNSAISRLSEAKKAGNLSILDGRP